MLSSIFTALQISQQVSENSSYQPKAALVTFYLVLLHNKLTLFRQKPMDIYLQVVRRHGGYLWDTQYILHWNLAHSRPHKSIASQLVPLDKCNASMDWNKLARLALSARFTSSVACTPDSSDGVHLQDYGISTWHPFFFLANGKK